MKTIGNFEEFKRYLPANWAVDYNERVNAIKVYLESGGIIKIGEMKGHWPKLIYPTKRRLEKQIEEAEEKLKDINKQIKEWRKRHKELQTNKVTDVLKRITDPLYWEHHARLLADPTYRETYELVEPPIHLIHRKEWRKRLKLFIKDKEYRLRLHEARTSEIGKRREGMKKEVEARMQFTRDLAETEKKKLIDKRDQLIRKIEAMKTLLQWAGG